MSATHRARPWFETTEPPAVWRWLLACSWCAEPGGRHRLTPDGCTDVVCLDDGTTMLCGPERSSWTFRLADGVTAVGARLRPGMAHVVFGIDVSTVVDRRVGLQSIVGRPRAEQIRNAIMSADLDDRRSALVEQLACVAVRHDAVAHPARQWIDTIVDVLAERPRATRVELAGACGMSVRELHRRSLRAFGYGTSTLARIMRFQRLLALASITKAPHSLVGLAVDAGYTDQAHLAHECRSITSLTPRAFLDEYFPTFPDPADPYKTAVPLITRIAR